MRPETDDMCVATQVGDGSQEERGVKQKHLKNVPEKGYDEKANGNRHVLTHREPTLHTDTHTTDKHRLRTCMNSIGGGSLVLLMMGVTCLNHSSDPMSGCQPA